MTRSPLSSLKIGSATLAFALTAILASPHAPALADDPATTQPATTQPATAPAAAAPATTAAATTAPAEAMTDNIERIAGAAALFETPIDRVSYALGVNIGSRFAADFEQYDVKLNAELLAKGLADAFDKKQILLSPAQMEATMEGFIAQMQERAAAQDADRVTSNKAYLETNAAKEDVKVTESGLQYKVLKAGDPNGKSPSAQDTVTVHYAGKFLDGTEFDSSIARGEPTSFPVGGVIPGWTEALQLMKVGDKWELTIPSDLAYGPGGVGGGRIPPNSVLIFEVELLDIAK